MHRFVITTCLALLLTRPSFSQKTSTDKKTATAASKKYLPLARLYYAPNPKKDSSFWWLYLLKDGQAALSPYPNPLRNDTTVKSGNYDYDAGRNAIRINWKEGKQTQWIKVQDSILTLPPDLTFKLYQISDSLEYKDGKRLYQ